MTIEYEEIVVGMTAEEFLKNLELKIVSGYRIKEVPYDFGLGVYSCRVYRYYSVYEASKVEKKDVEFRLTPPYTKSELRIAKWKSIIDICKKLMISAHGSRGILIDKILKAQKERAMGIEPDPKVVKQKTRKH